MRSRSGSFRARRRDSRQPPPALDQALGRPREGQQRRAAAAVPAEADNAAAAEEAAAVVVDMVQSKTSSAPSKAGRAR